MLHYDRLQPHRQTLDMVGKASRDNILRAFINYGRKKSYNIGPRFLCLANGF
jgi:hypothetical protein